MFEPRELTRTGAPSPGSLPHRNLRSISGEVAGRSVECGLVTTHPSTNAFDRFGTVERVMTEMPTTSESREVVGFLRSCESRGMLRLTRPAEPPC